MIINNSVNPVEALYANRNNTDKYTDKIDLSAERARPARELGVKKEDILYFGDMTQPGGNDHPVVQMGIDTITVRNHEDTAFCLRGILGVIGAL